MPFLTPEGSQPVDSSALSAHTLDVYLKRGYKIVSDGPVGVQLEAPRRMRMSTKLLFVLAVVMLYVYWPIALVLSVLVLIDYLALTPTDKVFLRRNMETAAEHRGDAGN